MPAVESTRPLEISPLAGEVKISNRGPNKLYYGENENVSATNKIGELSQGESLTISGKETWLIALKTPCVVDLEYMPSKASALGLAELDSRGFLLRAQSQVQWFNVKDYGAKGDGVTNDTAALKEALTAGAGATVYAPKGEYPYKEQLKVPEGTTLLLDRGASLVCEVTGTVDSILLGESAMLRGSGGGETGSSIKDSSIIVKAGANVKAVVANTNREGKEETVFLSNLLIRAEGGATVESLVDLVTVYVNTSIESCALNAGKVAQYCLRVQVSTSADVGQLSFARCWFNNAVKDCVLIEGSKAHTASETWFHRCAIEGWGSGSGSGFSGVKVVGYTNMPVFRDCHWELFGEATSATQAVYLKGSGVEEGVLRATIDACTFACGATSANKTGVLIDKEHNSQVQIKAFACTKVLAKIVNDEWWEKSWEGANVDLYIQGLLWLDYGKSQVQFLNAFSGKMAFFGATPNAQEKVAAAASNLATTEALANSLRIMAIKLGLMKE